MAYFLLSAGIALILCNSVVSVFDATRNQILAENLAKSLKGFTNIVFSASEAATVDESFTELVQTALGYSAWLPEHRNLRQIGVTLFCHMAIKLHPHDGNHELLPLQFFGEIAEGSNPRLNFVKKQNMETLIQDQIANSTLQGAYATAEYLVNTVPTIKNDSIVLNVASYYYNEYVWSVADGNDQGDYLQFALAFKAVTGPSGSATVLKRGLSFVAGLATTLRTSFSADDNNAPTSDASVSSGYIDLIRSMPTA